MQAEPAKDIIESLLPRPRSARQHPGTCHLRDTLRVLLPADLERPETLAVRQLSDFCTARLGLSVHTQPDTTRASADDDLPTQQELGTPHPGAGAASARDTVLRVARGSAGQPSAAGAFDAGARAAEGYRLRITPDGVELVGRSPAGVFYGLQTLRQIAALGGRCWPCLEIDDQPAFPVRGLSYDVSRGKVPTLATLKDLADRLAGLKMNHLQLYVEHTFDFAFDPEIAAGFSPLTADEIRELDAYCADRRIELVPSLASCGHMGRILSLPRYRHLAEVEASKGWEEMTWTERMRGLTLDVRNPQSRTLLERMYAEYLPLFRSRFVNVCCDETYDLGRGRNRQSAAQGIGPLYLEHLRFLHRLCRQYGKRMMFWGDVIKHHPQLLRQVPPDAIVLNWDYAPDADYDSTAIFRDAGLTTFVCPSTWSWNRVVADVNAAETNIRGHAVAGRRHGAAGLLNTEWGDEGHFNLLAGSWHPIALGAALAWNPDAPASEAFDRACGRLIFGDDRNEVVPLLRRVAEASDMKRSWPAFCRPMTETIPEETLSTEKLTRWRRTAAAAAELLSRHPRHADPDACDLRELALAFRLSALLAERFELSRGLALCGDAPDAALARRLIHFAETCEQMMLQYEANWLARNKPSCLHEITAVFRRTIEQARALAGKLGHP